MSNAAVFFLYFSSSEFLTCAHVKLIKPYFVSLRSRNR